MTKTHRITGRTAGLIAAAAVVTNCGGGNQSQSGSQLSSQVIQIDGSSTVFPVTEAVAEEFQRAHQGTRVTVGSFA